MDKQDEGLTLIDRLAALEQWLNDHCKYAQFSDDVAEAITALEAKQEAVVPEGYVLVPVEPTEEFIDEAVDRYFKLEGTTKDHFYVDERTRAIVKQWYRAFIGDDNHTALPTTHVGVSN